MSSEFKCIADIEKEYQAQYGVNIATRFADLGYILTVTSKRFPIAINGMVSYALVDSGGMTPVECLIRDMCRQIKEAER